MATFMPPWPEWQFEYMGSRFLGKLLGFWSGLWVSLLKKLIQFLGKTVRKRHNLANHVSNRTDLSGDARPSEAEFSFAKKLQTIFAAPRDAELTVMHRPTDQTF